MLGITKNLVRRTTDAEALTCNSSAQCGGLSAWMRASKARAWKCGERERKKKYEEGGVLTLHFQYLLYPRVLCFIRCFEILVLLVF